MIRICHLTTGLEVGGAERALVNITSQLDRSRFSSEIVSLIEPANSAAELKAADIPLTSLGMRRGRPSLSALSKLVRYLRKTQPTILQTWMYHADLLGLVARAFRPSMRLVWNVRCSDIVRSPGSYRLRWIVRLLARMSHHPDAVIVNSHRGRVCHEEIGYRPRHWIEIPNGVDPRRFRPHPDLRIKSRSSFGIDTGGFVIGMVASYHPMKDHATFLRASAQFVRDHPDVRFVLCGSGCTDDNAELRRAITQAGLSSRVILLGVRDDMEDVYPLFDLLTLSSAFGEGCPNVLIEGMACGVPCVATDVGDNREIVGDSGLIVSPGDPAALARAWQTIIARGTEGFSTRARTRAVERYQLKQIGLYYELIYENVVRTAGMPEPALFDGMASVQPFRRSAMEAGE